MIRYEIYVRGITQGVGFRPFIYNLAHKYNLTGFVQNIGFGVLIEAQGGGVENFIQDIAKLAPSMSRIDSISTKQIAVKNDTDFKIIQSETTSAIGVFFPPDFSLCKACEKEILDKNDRRFDYEFISCTECGPRYSIIKNMPFDRKNSAMDDFCLCDDCQSEYDNCADRRFHAQTISCKKCGPKLQGDIKIAAQKIKNGDVIALKGLGGFNLICDGLNSNAVEALRSLKQRPHKPLAVMFKTVSDAKAHLEPNTDELEALESIEKPIVLIKKDSKSSIAQNVAFDSEFLGAFLPHSPLHLLLCNELDCPIVVTSANLSSEPILTDYKEITKRFGDIYTLNHNRTIRNACDDSVVRVCDNKKIFLRSGRGFAPKTVKVDKKFNEPILCVGAHQKNTLSFCVDEYIITSPYIADLDNLSSIEHFEQTIEFFQKTIGVLPKKVICDMHPKYASTIYAKSLGVEVLELQHHKAHFYGALFDENLLHTPCFGGVWDGTGYGEDGNIWGGEFFDFDGINLTKDGGFEPFYLLGGEKAAKEPRLCALSLLFAAYGKDALKLNLPSIKAFSQNELENLWTIFEKKIGVVKTSSVGRLFDGVASILGLLQISGYEGQSGLLLESAFTPCASYSAKSTVELIRQIVQNPSAGAFFAWLSQVFITRAKSKNCPVVATGGVFLNSVLRNVLLQDMQKEGIDFRAHVRPNDESISFGQAIFSLLNSPL